MVGRFVGVVLTVELLSGGSGEYLLGADNLGFDGGLIIG
jgi:hypothetical protein